MQPEAHDLFSDKTTDILVPNRVQSVWVFPSEPPSIPDPQITKASLAMAPSTRSATRNKPRSNSGSVYHESDNSMDVDQQPPEVPPPEPKEEFTTSRGRKTRKLVYAESSDSSDAAPEDENAEQPVTTVSTKPDKNGGEVEDEEDHMKTRYQLRNRNRIVDSDEDALPTGHATRSRAKPNKPQEAVNGTSGGRLSRRGGTRQSKRTKSRKIRQTAQEQHDDDIYVDDNSSTGSADADGSLDDGVGTSSDMDLEDPPPDPAADSSHEDAQDGRTYSLRRRAKINYAIPPPLEEMSAPPRGKAAPGRLNGRNGLTNGRRVKPPGWSASGAELSRWMGGLPGDDSDSDYGGRNPRRPFGVGGSAGGGVLAGGAGSSGMLPADLAAAAGTPSNLGKVGATSLADTDPLGVNQSVTFDEVGGLDDHINSLKEMTLLPLLYPEVFQQFGLTPPRGVLFHGPPGTGKTLLARALAASCRSNGRGISFFMRKGADCLSKWVGEAERQLRLLFEEARNQQPSIIFFDEIDGLAPVRSSKQDQIHASIVSTLLALMDGMDGRGQVIVIGATNRPDAIDPALRRPGRFDREFYFPLPNLPARERILNIMTRKWAGWEAPGGGEKIKGLAEMTKGYGGADLRALCTEAALNAIQRRYPQIYKSSDRLLLSPESIKVQLRDFMIAIQKMVPSSARATAPPTTPLPAQLVPLLEDAVTTVKDAISRVVSTGKKRTALEEAEWEEDSEEGALKREMALQAMEVLRVYRPRVILHGAPGMGQRYIAEAALHSLDGFHIHGFDLGHLLSDSTRTPEATVVQFFTEAKRHKPSVIYIPSLLGWCAALSETTRSTMFALLDGLAPTDPILLLAYVDGPFSSLPVDVRSWFSTRHNRVEIASPPPQARERFFEDLLRNIRMPPNHFPDSEGRRKRILEELPLAPPLEPPAPTAAELELQAESDQRVITQLKYNLGNILTELKRKFKRFTKSAADEYGLGPAAFFGFVPIPPEPAQAVEPALDAAVQPGDQQEPVQPAEEVAPTGMNEEGIQLQVQVQPQLFDMDLERMHIELYRSKYLTSQDFLDDIGKIVHNASVMVETDTDRLFRAQALFTAAELSTQNFDAQFRLDCERMAIRERKRREEYRKNKGKARAVDGPPSSEVYPPGTRRSARHNGQEPEIAITDPVQLERRLKRQRSTERATESVDEGDEESRNAKRTRTSSAEPDVVAITSTEASGLVEPVHQSPPTRSHIVRFADEVETTAAVSSDPTQEPVGPEIRSRAGVEALLNPEPPVTHEGPSLPLPIPNGLSTLDEPSKSTPHSPAPVPDPTSLQSPQASGVSPVTLASPQPPEEIVPTPAQDPETPGEISQAMEVCESQIDNTPLPEFIVDEDIMAQLTDAFRESTISLNVEQLEELRATCLGKIWRHRAEWDRTSLLRNLCDLVREYVEEITDGLIHMSSPP